MKRYIAFLLALTLLLGASACTSRPVSSGTEEPPVEETPEPTPAPTPTEPPVQPTEAPPEETPEPTEEPEPAYRNFFNGEGLAEPDYERPFAVMINNLQAAMPQCGVGSADIIYEILAEGGVTRMMAIFSHVQDVDKIGSMRSIRPYYVDVAMAYGAVAVHAGYSDAAISRIRTYGVNNICGVTGSYASTTFYRDPNRMYNGIEHSLFTTGEKLYDCADKLGYALTVDEDYDNGLVFVKDGTPAGGESAEKVYINFNSYKYTNLSYHEDTGLYTAVQHGTDYIDADSDENVTFRNILVLYARTSVVDSYGRLDVQLIGEGDGHFVCGGKTVDITWSRASEYDCFHYALADGTPLELGVGTTYIAVLPTTGGEFRTE